METVKKSRDKVNFGSIEYLIWRKLVVDATEAMEASQRAQLTKVQK